MTIKDSLSFSFSEREEVISVTYHHGLNQQKIRKDERCNIMELVQDTLCRDAVCPCSEECPLGKALSVIGGKWKVRILCTLYVDGTQRYNDLVKKTKGITNAMLSSSLKELEADGIITRKQYAEIPPRVEYALTEHGRELWPILHQLAHWVTGEPLDDETV